MIPLFKFLLINKKQKPVLNRYAKTGSVLIGWFALVSRMFGVTFEEIAERLLNIPPRKTDQEKAVMAAELHRLLLDTTVLNPIVAIVKLITVPLAIQGHSFYSILFFSIPSFIFE